MARVYQCCVPWCCSETHDPNQWTTVRQNGDRQCPIHDKGAKSMSTQPRIGQYVSRLLGAEYHYGYVSDVVSTQTGGNGTEVHTVEIETLYGVSQGRVLVIVDGVGHLHETTQWQCSVCECFTTCVCDRNLQSGD